MYFEYYIFFCRNCSSNFQSYYWHGYNFVKRYNNDDNKPTAPTVEIVYFVFGRRSYIIIESIVRKQCTFPSCMRRARIREAFQCSFSIIGNTIRSLVRERYSTSASPRQPASPYTVSMHFSGKYSLLTLQLTGPKIIIRPVSSYTCLRITERR